MELSAIVVVPARNEQDQIGGCLQALAAQTLAPEQFETVVVLDACTDATESVVRDVAARTGLPVTLLQGPGEGAGAARRAGMDVAAARLFGLGLGDGLVACTDADSRPYPDWLERQLAHVLDGARAIAGLVEFSREEARALGAGVTRRREREAAARLRRVRRLDPTAAHHHFAGASIAVTAATYREVGGIEPLIALEDAAFAQRLAARGVAVRRPADVRVQTSTRRSGRARRGLAIDLAVSCWLEQRRYRAQQFSLTRLVALKAQTSVAVVIPTKQCAGTVAGVITETVAPLREAGLVDDVLVVDAASSDGTAEQASAAGARVLQQDDLLASWGPALGKGDAMWRAVHATDADLICFLDGDTANPHPDHLRGLIGPLLCDVSIQLVKGAFERPLHTGTGIVANEGGRVTELMARPLLNLHEPGLAGFAQPLAGEFAARRELLASIEFPVGYGVEVAILIDALRLHGLDALAECHLGTRQNRHQPLRELGEMAYAVLAAVEQRRAPPRSAVGGHYLRPWQDGDVVHVPVAQRPPLASIQPPPGTPSR